MPQKRLFPSPRGKFQKQRKKKNKQNYFLVGAHN